MMVGALVFIKVRDSWLLLLIASTTTLMVIRFAHL